MDARFNHTTSNESHVCLFVGDLSVRYNRENLHKLFTQVGLVVKVELRHRTKDYKTISGFGFVTLESKDIASDAMTKFNRHAQFGRKIRVNWAVKPDVVVEEPTAEVFFSFKSSQTRNMLYEQTLVDLVAEYVPCAVLDVDIKNYDIDVTSDQYSGSGFLHFPLTIEGVTAAKVLITTLRNVSVLGINVDCKVAHSLSAHLRSRSDLASAVSGEWMHSGYGRRDFPQVVHLTPATPPATATLDDMRHLMALPPGSRGGGGGDGSRYFNNAIRGQPFQQNSSSSRELQQTPPLGGGGDVHLPQTNPSAHPQHQTEERTNLPTQHSQQHSPPPQGLLQSSQQRQHQQQQQQQFQQQNSLFKAVRDVPPQQEFAPSPYQHHPVSYPYAQNRTTPDVHSGQLQVPWTAPIRGNTPTLPVALTMLELQQQHLQQQAALLYQHQLQQHQSQQQYMQYYYAHPEAFPYVAPPTAPVPQQAQLEHSVPNSQQQQQQQYLQQQQYFAQQQQLAQYREPMTLNQPVMPYMLPPSVVPPQSGALYDHHQQQQQQQQQNTVPPPMGYYNYPADSIPGSTMQLNAHQQHGNAQQQQRPQSHQYSGIQHSMPPQQNYYHSTVNNNSAHRNTTPSMQQRQQQYQQEHHYQRANGGNQHVQPRRSERDATLDGAMARLSVNGGGGGAEQQQHQTGAANRQDGSM